MKKEDEKRMMREFSRFLACDFDIDIKDVEEFQNIQMSAMPSGLYSIANGYEKAMKTDLPISNITPVVIEESQRNMTAMDVFSRLMMERIIFLGEPVTDYASNIIMAQLLFLNSQSTEKDVTLYINSPGGSVSAGLGIFDTMNLVNCDVGTVCTGMAASMAFVLAISGEKGKRHSLPNSRFMQHQPMGGAYGQASDIEINYKEIQKVKEKLYSIISEKTGQPYEKIEKDADRDFWLSAQEAKDYGCIDEIITNMED